MEINNIIINVGVGGGGVGNGAGEVSRLLSKDFHYKPFDIKKLTFHALAVDCVADEMIAIGKAE